MFLMFPRAELAELTGYQLPAWQARWLDAHHWRYERSISGRPIVLRAHAESRLSDPSTAAAAVSLNLAAIQKRA
jgi:hypothetical protein